MEPCLFRHGKEDIRFYNSPEQLYASMEPCLFRHGKGAKTSPLRKMTTVLQWSHVFSDMVRVLVLLRRDQDPRASMEPCLFRHGKETGPGEPAEHPQFASMEPCLFRHGKDPARGVRAPVDAQLQWSHVFSDMVSQAVIAFAAAACRLQWSHVFSDMVRGTVRVSRIHVGGASMEPCLFRHGKLHVGLGQVRILTPGFNGAMSFQTW